ncbi:MAG: hypothetical protein H6907_03265 [Hyphomicrobiales bacterium]|nr:hypothetical protein [Hyphomicrobiales bacterium]MCP5370727.1 hypothetical protein [Hyphomicrobiales bacterium]
MTTTWGTLTPQQRAVAAAAFEALETLDALAAAPAEPANDGRVRFADLRAVATDPDRPLGAGLARALAADRRLGADFERLVARRAAGHIRAAAAADTGRLSVREGNGFRITLKPSRADGAQVYVIIDLGPRTGEAPRSLFVCGGEPVYQKHGLPAANDGVVQILADAGSDLVRGLADRRTEVFLR